MDRYSVSVCHIEAPVNRQPSLVASALLLLFSGCFRPDGTFVRWPGWPAYDSAALSEAFRRAVLRLFVRRG